MSNAWFYYIIPLAIATVFVVGGAVALRQFRRNGRDSLTQKRDLGAGCGGTFLLVVGGAMALVTLLTSPSPWERERLFDHVFRTPPENIERFVIQPGRTGDYRPLTQSQVVIDNPARIRRIAEILRTAREVLPSHPRARWTASVEMITRDGTYYFDVSAGVLADPNGTLVSARSADERDAWNLGSSRAEALDQVMEDAVNSAREH